MGAPAIVFRVTPAGFCSVHWSFTRRRSRSFQNFNLAAVMKVFGEDLDTSTAIAEQLRTDLAGIAGGRLAGDPDQQREKVAELIQVFSRGDR